ncbi:MAG: hypothetical protein M1816_002949 [Peltula sp. TS41687]|nr:MAG: hypothetical protein M1816_002949 [Peltula sp. TS41687]
MASRLRKTFQYPTDEDDPLPEHLDEEEQEALISNLRREDSDRNALYTNLLLSLPLLLSVPYIPLFFRRQTTYQTRLLILLSLTSLLSTAYTLRYIPVNHEPRDDQRRKKGNNRPLRSRGSVGWAEGEDGPLKRYLHVLNGVICGLLALVSLLLVGRRGDVQGVVWMVPGFVLMVVMVARRIMASVDVEELEDLRYEYKGA